MSKYTTGEMAKLCNVSVRTVQFYDIKGVLNPSELSEGGRRLYTDSDLTKLRLICTLKAIGLSLDSIKGIMNSESQGKVLTLLLDEQLSHLNDSIEEQQKQIETIKAIKECIRNMTIIPVNSIIGIEHIMKDKKKLRKVHGKLLAVGCLMDVIQIGTIVLWITKGMWIPFAVGMPIVILLAALLIIIYYKNTAYICTGCNATFQPSFLNFMFSKHTPKTRKLTCTKCGHTGYCVEVYHKLL
jgi:DNA-binding transcriptional MerR regulator/DNA-directed RNA polymerase subunit RPC12/RpoP